MWFSLRPQIAAWLMPIFAELTNAEKSYEHLSCTLSEASCPVIRWTLTFYLYFYLVLLIVNYPSLVYSTQYIKYLSDFPVILFFLVLVIMTWRMWRICLLTYLLTYLLTPWCRVLLEQLTGLQLVKKFPPFHGTRRFITALTSVRQQSLSWASPFQSIYPHPTSWRAILILSTHLRLALPIGLFPSDFPTKTLYTPLSSLIRATCPAHLTELGN